MLQEPPQHCPAPPLSSGAVSRGHNRKGSSINLPAGALEKPVQACETMGLCSTPPSSSGLAKQSAAATAALSRSAVRAGMCGTEPSHLIGLVQLPTIPQ